MLFTSVTHFKYWHKALHTMSALGHFWDCDEVGTLLWMSNSYEEMLNSWVWRRHSYFQLVRQNKLFSCKPDSTRQHGPPADYTIAVTDHGPWFQMEEIKIPSRGNSEKKNSSNTICFPCEWTKESQQFLQSNSAIQSCKVGCWDRVMVWDELLTTVSFCPPSKEHHWRVISLNANVITTYIQISPK